MIHQYKLGGHNIVLDIYSGSVHLVDDVAYDIIEKFETGEREEVISSAARSYADCEDITKADIEDCYDQIASLKANGQLFAPDQFEPMAGTLKEKSDGIVKALCLHVAHVCNLNCSYCFASQGKYHGDRALMSLEAVSYTHLALL